MRVKARVIGSVALLLLFTVSAMAQTVEISEPVQLTFNLVGANGSPHAATNGTEWGIVHTRRDQSSNIYFVLATYDGEFIEGRALYSGEKDTLGFQHPRIAAHPNGWAMTYEYRDTGSEAPDRYFVLLDKRGRKTGHQALLVEDTFAGYFAPFWTGSMFVVFYEKLDENFVRNIWVAFFDDKAKRIVPDRMVTHGEETSFGIDSILPTSMGFLILGGEELEHENFREVFMLVGLDGSLIEGPKYIDSLPFGFYAHTAIWNGTGYAVAGEEYPEDNLAPSRPAVRMLTDKGKWLSGPFRQTAHGESYMQGLGFNGSRYVSIAMQTPSYTVYCQELDGQLKPVGEAQFMDDSSHTAGFSNRTYKNGSDTFYLASNRKSGYSKQAYNLYFSRVTFPHSGKPNITFFDSGVQEFNGKTYALLNWDVAGSRTVKLKTKGGRWTLPASGFIAVQINGNKKVRFKIVASNNAGRSKAKVKIKP